MKKKNSEDSKRIKNLVGSKAMWELPEPVSILQFVQNDVNMTQIAFESHINKPIAVDDVFAAFLASTGNAIDPLPWIAIKPWLDNTREELDQFWIAFNSALAIQERMWCCDGDKYVSWANERIIIKIVARIRELSELDNSNTDECLMLQIKLAEWVMSAVESNPQSLRRMLTLLKKPHSLNDLTNRDRTNLNVFTAFVKLVATDKKLPTKKQVAIASCLVKEKRRLSRSLSELGLSGLPEAPKSSK